MLFLEYIEYFLSSFQFIFAATLASFVLKLCILFFLIRRIIFLKKIEKPFFFLVTILVSNMFSDFAWILKLGQILFFPQLNYQVVLFFTYVAWIFFVVQYQTLVLFIESLVVQKYQFSIRQKIFSFISVLFCIFFAGIAVMSLNVSDLNQRHWLEITTMMQDYSVSYVMFLLAIPSLLIVLYKIRRDALPLILKKQLFVLINGLIIPVLVADFMQ